MARLAGISRPLIWFAVVVLLVIAALAAAVLGGRGPAPAPAPTPTPDVSRALLAFARGSDIYLADEQSGRSIKPAGTTGLSLGSWSPDGRWLSLQRQGQVLLLDVATMQLIPAPRPTSPSAPVSPSRIPTTPLGPTAAPIARPTGPAPLGYSTGGWLRYGQSILLHEMGSANLFAMFAVDIETGATIRLPDVPMCRPVLSPDARYMAGIGGADFKSVIVVDVATGVVVEASAFGGDGCSFGMGNDSPSWSPDGSRLVVVTRSSLRVVNRDGTSGRDIVNLDFRNFDPFDRALRSVKPLWAPGGKWIAFHDPQGLEIIRPDGTDRRLLGTGDLGDGLYFDLYKWTPDSTRIDYRIGVGDEHPDGFVLWSVDVETAVSHPIEVAQPYVDAFARQPITADTPPVTLP